MSRLHHGHAAFHLNHRQSKRSHLESMMDQLPNLSRRDNTCGKDDKAVQCAKPAESNSITIPVVLAVVYVLSSKIAFMMADLWSRIPVVSAVILFLYLHRRHVRKQRQEDANDPHKSLDFGITMANAGASKKSHSGGAETTELGTEKSLRRDRYVSMDMGPGSPYILPPGLQGSRESLHSLSRNMNTTDDPYRPATSHASPDSPHSYPRSRGFGDDSSSLASGRYANENMNQNLLGNAQGISRSTPPSVHSPQQVNPVVPAIRAPETQPARKPFTTSNAGPSLSAPVQLDPRNSYMGKDSADIQKSNHYLGPLIHSREPSADLHPQSPDPAPSNTPLVSTSAPTLQKTSSRKSPPPKIITTSAPSRPPRLQSLKAPTVPIYEGKSFDDTNDYGDTFKLTPPSPRQPPMPPKNNTRHNQSQERMPLEDDYHIRELHAPLGVHDSRRVSMGVRPLPPDDPTDNPEQRANRIRSFYKEYFDDSKSAPSAPAGAYVEDYDQNYQGDKGEYVAAQPQFAVPYARRAMTPPPRAPPRFQGGARHQQSFSGSGRSMTPGLRPFSPASSRQFGPSGRGSPRPNLPPPSPLRILPTPHLMKEDAFALPTDFAPPNSYKDRAAGRPESPLGGLRPYSPMVPAHLPLASSFDDLSVMPSP